MSDIIYSTPLRSSLPQERWRREADAAQARRVAVAEAGRRRERAAQQLRQQMQNATVTATAEQSLQTQFTALCNHLIHQIEIKIETTRDALVEFLVNENQELRVDVQRLVKRARVEIEDSVERKTAAFRPPTVRGTYDETEVYSQHDICIKNGGSYIARRDDPGYCPGGGWQQLTQPGKSGAKGERGFSGARGPQGESGANFIGWRIDKKNFVAIPFMSDGKIGPPLYLREFFEQFFSETNQARERE